MHITQLLSFTVAFSLAVSSAVARNSLRSHEAISAVLKHKRVASPVSNGTAELEKRDQTKYVFMHHVRRLHMHSTTVNIDQPSFSASPDCWQCVPLDILSHFRAPD